MCNCSPQDAARLGHNCCSGCGDVPLELFLQRLGWLLQVWMGRMKKGCCPRCELEICLRKGSCLAFKGFSFFK